MNTTDGYAIVANTYDANGKADYEAYYKADGSMAVLKKGYSILRKTYNGAKKVTKTIYCDKNGNPIVTTDRFAIAQTEYDSQNRVVYQGWFDASGNRVTKKDYSSFLTKEYIDQEDGTQTVRTRYFAANGNPVYVKNGYAVLEEYKNAAGTKIGEAYFDTNLRPVYKRKQSYTSYHIDFNEDGTKTYSYYNAYGTLVKTEVK